MGDCIYLRAPGGPTRTPTMRVLASKHWANPSAAGAAIGEGHFLNTTAGIWLYGTELENDPEGLCARLRALVRMVETGEAAALYAEATRVPRKTVILRPKASGLSVESAGRTGAVKPRAR